MARIIDDCCGTTGSCDNSIYCDLTITASLDLSFGPGDFIQLICDCNVIIAKVVS